MTADGRLVAAATLCTFLRPEDVVPALEKLETALARLPKDDPPATAGEPGSVPVGWVRDSLARLERWASSDDSAHSSDADRLSTIAAVLTNLRAELRQFAGEP